MSQFFEILIFDQDIWRIDNYVCESCFLRNSDKSLLYRGKTNEKNSETQFCKRETTQDDNAKINVYPNIPCTFLLFKASAFPQIFFPKKMKIEVLGTLVSLKGTLMQIRKSPYMFLFM